MVGRKMVATLGLASVLMLGACGSDDDSGDSAGSSEQVEQTTASAATDAAGETTAAPDAAGETTAAADAAAETTAAEAGAEGFVQVSANNATVAEMTAAFEQNGIANAQRWAREVEEYRPYDVSDPTMASLRQELAKYNPAAGVVDDIVASLTLP